MIRESSQNHRELRCEDKRDLANRLQVVPDYTIARSAVVPGQETSSPGVARSGALARARGHLDVADDVARGRRQFLTERLASATHGHYQDVVVHAALSKAQLWKKETEQ